MSLIRQLSSRSRIWFALCAATVACNSIFDIQEPIEKPAAQGDAEQARASHRSNHSR